MTLSEAAEIQGFTEPYRDIDVSGSEPGILAAINVEEGDRVAKGDVLARMDSELLEITLDIAESIKDSRGRLETAIEELELKTAVVGKLEKLHQRQHASRQELERAAAQQRIAEAHLKSVREELEVKKLEFQRAKIQLERRSLKSPAAGIVTRVFKNAGEMVSIADPVVVKIVQLDPLLVVFLVPADRARELPRGKPVRVRFDEPTRTEKGIVEFVSPTIDPQSGLTRVRVRLENPKERLPCGATCFLILAGKESTTVASSY